MTEHRFCLVVGAGPSGLIQAAELLRKGILSHNDFLILERNDGYGGVWKQATYPGAACDVPSNVYQVSFHRNPNWSRRYAAAQEISQYYDGFAKRYGLLNNTRFNQKVIKAEWSDETMLWTVTSENTKTKQTSLWTANVIVHATGLFNRAKVPAIPGASTFKGESWHTADWPTNANLNGKRVAIIGTGPSAAQVIPRIQPLVKSLTVYQRSTAYCFPRQDYQYSATVHFLFNYIPFIHSFYCLCMYWFFEILLHKVLRPGNSFSAVAQSTALKHFESQVTKPELREKLRPTGNLGCKRMLVLDDYYPTFQQSNVDLIVDPPVRITETGIISKPVTLVTSEEAKIIKNELSARSAGDEINEELGLENYNPVTSNSIEQHTEVDVIIWGTGWVLQDFGTVYEVIGRGGKTLAEHWGDDCHALYGIATSDFPNFVMLFGPNTATPWGSLIYGFEMQSQYNANFIRELKRRNANGDVFAMMPKPDVEKAYTESLQSELDKLVMSPSFGCKSYYSNSKGRNTHLFPFHQMYYRYLTRRLNLKDYLLLEKDWGEKSPTVRNG